MTDSNVIEMRPPNPDDDGEGDEVAVQHAVRDEDDGVISTELVDVRGAIDPPAHKPTWQQWSPWDARSRRVIRPVWAQSWANFRAWVLINLRELGFIVTWHITRSPIYAWRALRDELRGATRLLGRFTRWVTDSHGRTMALVAVETADPSKFHSTRKEWRGFVHRRLLGSAAGLVVGLAGLAAAYSWAPPWVLPLVIVLACIAVGYIGHDPAQPVTDDYYVDKGHRAIKLTSTMVLNALSGVGIGAISKAIENDPRNGVKFLDPIARDGDAGYVVTVELPGGTTAGEVMERREKLASGLRRQLGTVWPERIKGEHPGVLRIFVGDHDINAIEQGSWPLEKVGQVDLFRPVPFGTDQRGRAVAITLMFASGVIGATPRMGKTFALRELLLCAALDPRAKVYAFDKKGSGDLSPLEHVAHAYTVGDEDEDIELDLSCLQELREEMRRRYKVLRKLPKHRAPETKVTPELASDPSLGMEPVFVGVDECQFWFEHKEHKDEFVEVVTDLVKRGPAAGIMWWGATQRPDAKSIPTSIRDNTVMRFCLMVMDYRPNDDVLGTGMHKAGVRATMFSRDDLGIGYLVGEGADPKIVRTYYIDATKADKIGQRARALRERSGTLSGYCIGEQEVPDLSSSLVDDLPRVFVDCERLHSDEVIERLQSIRPRTYEGWTKVTLANACRDQLGMTTKQTRIGEKVAAGLNRAAVLEAVGTTTDQHALPPSGTDSEANRDAP